MTPTSPSFRRFLRGWLLLAPLALLAGCGGGGGGGGPGGSTPSGPDVTPPTITLDAPTSIQARMPGDRLQVAFTADDDRDATVEILLDADSDLLTTGDQTVLYSGTDSNGTPVAVDLDITGIPAASYGLFVRADDGTNPVAWDGMPKSLVVLPALAGVAPPRANRYGVSGSQVVFSVGEAEQGGVVLNGDGDAGDGVVFVVDALTAIVTQTGRSIDVSPVGLLPTAQILPGDTGGFAWHEREADQGAVLNGDGDQTDTVISFVAPQLGIPAATNPTGGAVLTAAGSLGRRVVLYSESAHGGDLNGDGDALDQLAALLDYASNTLPVVFRPQLMPGTGFVGTAGYGAYVADEATEGAGNTGAPINADPDMVDKLTVVVDLVTGLIASVGPSNVDPTAAIGVSPNPPFPLAAYTVDEALASPGAALNGDLDSTDFVPAANVGGGVEHFPTAAAGGPSPPLNAGPAARFAFAHGSLVVHLGSEEGTSNYNGDGDTTDTEILWWADASAVTPAWRQITAAAMPTGIALDGGAAAMVFPGWLGLSVAEVSNTVDLNGDGDQADQVYLLVDLTTTPPVVHNTGIVPLAPATLPLPGATLALTGVGGDTGVVIQAAETANGDLNADGDAVDTVLVYLDWSAPSTPVVLGDTGGLHAAVHGGVIGVTAYEALTTTDHNGDGDTLDIVFRVFDASGNVLLPGVLSDPSSVPAADAGDVWAFLRSEPAEQRDLNSDGDMGDLVLGIWLR